LDGKRALAVHVGRPGCYTAFNLRAASIAASLVMCPDTLRGGVDDRSTT
jgi:hypothetical protein